jgi:NAD(P)-dependent dehydrogenase (short-subunit alcohol dehydrogenase family)
LVQPTGRKHPSHHPKGIEPQRRSKAPNFKEGKTTFAVPPYSVTIVQFERISRLEQAIMQVDLSGKTAIVTGSASGVGLATALQFVKSGLSHLVAVDVAAPPPELQQLLDERPDKALFVRGDVGVEETAHRYATLALERFGRIDILVNNAGVALVKPIHEHTPEEWDFVMNTNVKALYFSARHVVPAMIRQRSGTILNTGSISGHVGIIGQGAYGPSKGALHQMTRQMAIEYAPHGIRVNAVALGTVDTPIVQESARQFGDPEAFWAMLRNNHPIGRVATAAEVACFFTYLASDLASFFTGSILSMDGGYIAH